MLYNAYSQKLSGTSRSRKDPVSYLNIMVVGSVGSGKTAFVRTFCETLKDDIIPGSYKESVSKVLEKPLRSTRELYTVSMHIDCAQQQQRTALTLIDTPGFTSGVAVDHQIRYIAKYIDYQFERTLAEESKVKRDAKALDTHIHTCLYFIDSSNINGLSGTDKYILKRLSTRVNIVPVIGKADTLTAAQCQQLKNVFRREIFDIVQLPVYGFIEVDDDDVNINTKQQHGHLSYRKKILDMLNECVEEDKDEDAMAMIDYLHNMPFTLISYEEDAHTGRPISVSSNSTQEKEQHQSSDDDAEMEGKEEEQDSQKDKQDIIQKKKNMAISKTVLGRSYPWATVECCNPTHCDFVLLKDNLLSRHRDMLRIDTFERFYEQYRTEQLLNRKVNRVLRVESKEGVPLV